MITAAARRVTVDLARSDRSTVGDPEVQSNDAAFDVMMRVARRKFAALAYAMVGDRTEAEDIVADAFAKVWIKSRRQHITDLEHYTHRTVVNLCVARHRRRFLERRERDSRTIDWRRPAQPISTDERVTDEAELHAALLGLPMKQRSVVILRLVSDLPESDVAAVLGISIGTVKSRLARGLTSMRSQLQGTES